MTVTGSQSVVHRFDVTPNQSSNLLMGGLPTGTDTFAAQAFPTSCAAVTTNSVANWISARVTATITAGTPTNVVNPDVLPRARPRP